MEAQLPELIRHHIHDRDHLERCCASSMAVRGGGVARISWPSRQAADVRKANHYAIREGAALAHARSGSRAYWLTP
jgi:hypothetical protein